MLESKNRELDLSGLQEKVDEELAKIKNRDIPPNLQVTDPYSWDSLGETLKTAELNVNAGADRIAAGHHRGWKRVAARILAKTAHIFGRAMTIPQRKYNNAMLHSQHIILNGLRDMNRKTAMLEYQLAEKSAIVNYLKSGLVNQERAVSILLQELRGQHVATEGENASRQIGADVPDLLDPIYLAFENRFRGSREEIKKRLCFYLPLIRKTGAGEENRPILDLGCGRGEWLEILSEQKLVSRGIDLNPTQVGECTDRGFLAEEKEALSYLRSLPDSSVGAITSFHLIEHLDFETRIALFDECARVLMSGGPAIFETPNPRNLLVGSCDFWSDPTHLKPLYPETHQFLMEYRGFIDVELLFLHPHDEEQRLPEVEAPQLASRLNDLLCGARDYAVVGFKA